MTDKTALDLNDSDRFLKALSNVIGQAQSLVEIETWLKQQSFVESVLVSDYLLKSNPPLREIFIVFTLVDSRSRTERKILTLVEHRPDKFAFHSLV